MDMLQYSPQSLAEPPSLYAAYASTVARSPRKPLIQIPQTLTEGTGPINFGEKLLRPAVADLTRQGKGEPLGERIIVSGRVLDDRGRPIPHTVIEVWQCNAAGRYIHKKDQHDAPLDPNFIGQGRVITDEEGRYRFITIKPGAYPWRNHHNAWRPAHIHFSLFGPCFATRLITQMYFPGDPLLDIDPIACAVPADARQRMVSHFDINTTENEWALGYVYDIVLRGRDATPMENS
ncbi:protocatechuate 3,4-dioxygenase [Acetobacter tropicalis]|uniref:Protocatechuate 3,4-dioxygenase n=1 Tax=Acetobacter tropicalis TaxID=104102 RepID=A0A149TQR2_9PROT|nr:protocatechuate 3,4-dioxygenase subunit beta [Acetobacter tropicalis]KXV55503.1 protocatechuate 3,4-dioxygenase [Acetobacter tropicalis]